MRKALLILAGLFISLSAQARMSYAHYVNYTQAVMSATIMVLVLIVGGMALRWMYRHRYLPSGGKLSFWRYALKNALVKLTLVTIASVAVVNLVSPDPYDSSEPLQVAKYAKLRRIPGLAEVAYHRLAQQYPENTEYQFEYITAHYLKEEWATSSGEAGLDAEIDFHYPIVEYVKMGEMRDPVSQDISHLCLGMINYYQYPFGEAMDHFRAIKDTTMAYRNLLIGRIHAAKGHLDSAEHYFRKEIALEKASEKAIADMANTIYVHQHDSLAKMARLMADPTTASHVPYYVKRYVYTKQSRLLPYLTFMIADWWHDLNWIGFLGAFLGTLVWVYFLRKLDPNRPEPWLPMLATFTGGALFTFLALVFYDFFRFDLGFYLQGNSFMHDFFYCVFGIGVIEEFVKIIPFLLLLQFTKRIDNPVSYIFYASLSALGFAFIENLGKFDNAHVSIMHGRVLICIVFHMFATSTVAFGMMLGKYRYRKLQWPLFFLFFFIAAFMHGFYDFWLLSESAGAFMFFTYALFIYGTFQYAGYINNCVNNTRVFRGRAVLDPNKLAVFLTVGLIGVLLFEYVALSVVYGANFGNYALIHSLGMGSFLLFFVVLNLSNIDVVQDEWIWLRLWNFGTRLNYNKALGQRLELRPKSKDGLLTPHLPAQGEVIARISINGDSRYYLFQLDRILDLHGVVMEYLLLRAKKEGEIPEPNQGVEAMVVAFRDQESLKRKEKRKTDFKMIDSVFIA